MPAFIRRGRGLPAFAATTVAVMVAVILWGAVVRITSSGGGCGSHWPLCNGDFFPHHPRVATIIEFTHRATTGICATLALLVLAWTFLAKTTRRARVAAVVSVLLLFVEAFLGRALVIHGYVENNTSDARSIMQCVHFTNTMLLLAAFTLTWWWLRDDAPASSSAPKPLAAAAILLTLVVGATGSVAALADTLFPSPSLSAAFASDFAANAPLLVRMRWMHPAAFVFACIAVLWLCVRVRSRTASIVAGLLVLQFVLGAGDVLFLAPWWMQVLHLLGADVFWIALVILASESVRTRSIA
jgi:heme a synthase